MKLTKPQRELLETLPRVVVESYPPAKALVAKGLAKWNKGDGWYGNPRLEITNAGLGEICRAAERSRE